MNLCCPPLGFLPHCLSIGLYVFLLPQLLLESIASNDFRGPVCIIHRREGAGGPQASCLWAHALLRRSWGDRLDTLTLEPRKTCVPVNRGPVVLLPLLQNSGVTMHREITQKACVVL